MREKAPVLACLCVLLLTLPLSAQEPTAAPINLGAAVEMALQHYPTLRAAQANA